MSSQQSFILETFLVAFSIFFAGCGGGGVSTPPPPTCTDSETIACVQSGALQGVIEDNVRAFRGIPFAAAPIGNLRWKPPAPPVTWQGVRDASQFGSVCTQINFNLELVGGEDCLFVNVFTSSPVPTSEALRASMRFSTCPFRRHRKSEWRQCGSVAIIRLRQ